MHIHTKYIICNQTCFGLWVIKNDNTNIIEIFSRLLYEQPTYDVIRVNEFKYKNPLYNRKE
jgi:hypothetical protein